MKTISIAAVILLSIGSMPHEQWGHQAIQPLYRAATAWIGGDTQPEFHAFHVSKCLADSNEGEQALQMILHLFIDDLEEGLRRQGADNLFLCTKKEHEDAERYIYRYLQQHLAFEVNGEPREYTFIGKEVSEDLSAVWCYLEITDIPNLKSLKVNNNILMETFDDQKNLVSISGPAKKQGLLLFQKGDTVKKAQF